MSGTVGPPRSTAAGLTVGTGHPMSPMLANYYRFAVFTERLSTHLRAAVPGDSAELFSLCISIARGIDYALANNEVPARVQDLPILLKQVCERRNDVFLHSAIMVLMISVKNACRVGWFPEHSESLINLANEMGNSFCCAGDASNKFSDASSVLLTIKSRFYPLMEVGKTFSSLEIKSGYGAYLMDFHISKNIGKTQDKIHLFVVQTDNTETSACIVSPQKVSFLLNGMGVKRRTNVLMDTGPQLPTNVTGMLKFGTNIVQAVGQFDGRYLIAVAFVSMKPIPENPMLQDYVHPVVPALDPDSDVMEGPSRISLNCPISRTRIRTPVKGQSCKHHQCFDFRNYIEINSRRPSWRCPHCNQPCCYTDIRSDQNIVKVLREVGEDINDVIISADGSWKAVFGTDKKSDQSLERNLSKGQLEQQELGELNTSTAVPTVLDLTEGDDKMDDIGSSDIEDHKPPRSTLQNRALSTDSTVPLQWNNADDIIQYAASQPGLDFWSNVLHASGSLPPSVRLGIPSMSMASPACTGPISPVMPDAISPSLNRDAGTNRSTDLASTVQNQIPASANMQLQQQSPMDPATNNEYGRLLQIYRQINNTSAGDEGIAVRPQAPNLQHMSRPNIIPGIPSASFVASQGRHNPRASSFGSSSSQGATFRGLVDLSQQLPRSHLNRNQAQAQVPGQTLQKVGSPQPNPPVGASAMSSGLPGGPRNIQLQQALRVPHSRSQVSGPIQSRHGGGQAGVGVAAAAPTNHQAGFLPASSRPTQMARQPPFVAVEAASPGTPYPMNVDRTRTATMEQRGSVGGAVPATPGPDAPGSSASEQNWRPTGRMRGSISGRDFETLKDLMIQPTQPSQVARPPTSLTPSSSRPSQVPRAPPHLTPTSSRPSAPPHLQALVNRNVQVPRPPSGSTTDPSLTSGTGGSLPQ